MSHLSDSYRVSLQKPRRGSCEETVKGDLREGGGVPTRRRGRTLQMYTAADLKALRPVPPIRFANGMTLLTTLKELLFSACLGIASGKSVGEQPPL